MTDIQHVRPNANALNAENYRSFKTAKTNDDIIGGDDIAQIRSYAAFARAQAQAIHKTIAATNGIDDVAAIKAEATETAQTFAKVGIYADQRIGEILRELPKAKGNQYQQSANSPTGEEAPTKAQALEDAGIGRKQAYDLQAMAANPEVVEAVIAKAEEEGKVVCRKQVIDAIRREKKAEEVKKAQSLIESEQGEGSAKLIVGNSIGKTVDCDLLLTDPPYSTDVEDMNEFVNSWLYAALDGVKSTGFAYVFVGAYPNELRAYFDAEVPSHLHLEQVLVWEYKNTLGQNPKGRYKQNWQACLFYRGVDAPDLNCPLTNEQWAVQEVNAPDGRLGDRYHAWQKPLDLVTRFIRHSTAKGMTVYDPFACTGTTLVAAAKLGRNGIGYEISEENAKIAFERGVSRGGNV